MLAVNALVVMMLLGQRQCSVEALIVAAVGAGFSSMTTMLCRHLFKCAPCVCCLVTVRVP